MIIDTEIEYLFWVYEFVVLQQIKLMLGELCCGIPGCANYDRRHGKQEPVDFQILGKLFYGAHYRIFVLTEYSNFTLIFVT